MVCSSPAPIGMLYAIQADAAYPIHPEVMPPAARDVSPRGKVWRHPAQLRIHIQLPLPS